jgi:hypothetical protein
MRNLKFITETTAVPKTASDAFGNTTLAAGTYYAELDVDKIKMKGLMSVQWIYDTDLEATITIEATNCVEADIEDPTTNLKWIDVAAIPDVVPVSTAGSVIGSWADVGYGRMRAKVVVTVQGVLRGCFNSKEQ